MNIDISQIHVAIFFGVLSFISAFISWAMNITIRNGILTKNEETMKEIASIQKAQADLKNEVYRDIITARDKAQLEVVELRKQMAGDLDKMFDRTRGKSQPEIAELRQHQSEDAARFFDKLEDIERMITQRVSEIHTKLADEYVRTDLYQQSTATTNDRLENLRQIIEMYMNKIEGNLLRQIEDLKERIK